MLILLSYYLALKFEIVKKKKTKKIADLKTLEKKVYFELVVSN